MALSCALSGCDAPPEERAVSDVLDVEDGECVELADLALACAEDETCDPADLADVPLCGEEEGVVRSEWLEAAVDELKQSLVDRAQRCFEEEDGRCLWQTYWALAAGAKALGLHTASGNMFNFLHCGHDPLFLNEDLVREEPVVAAFESQVAGAFWCQAEQAAASATGATIPLEQPGRVVAAEGDDLWYGLGNFTVSAVGTAYVSDGIVTAIEVETTVYDVYDWHEGLTAGGNDQQVAGFRDDWAAWLVDEGRACEFEMGVVYREYVARPASAPCEVPAGHEEPRDE